MAEPPTPEETAPEQTAPDGNAPWGSAADGALGGVLMRTLNRAADAAPPPPEALYRTVTRQHARRRGRIVALAAAGLVLVLLGGVVAAVRGTVADESAQVAAPVVQNPVRLPASIGGEYQVDAVAPDGAVVVRRGHLVGKQAELLLVRPDGSAEIVAAYPQTEANGAWIENVTANGEWLVWGVRRPPGPIDVWGMRWDDPTPRRIVAGTGYVGMFQLTLDGDRVVYGPTPKGIRVVPAAGGTPTLLPGTEGYYRVFWPWLVHDESAPHHPAGTPTTLWNVETGERTETRFRTTDSRGACSPVWCVDVGDAGDDRITTERVDGTDRRSWPGFRSRFGALTPLRDRYLPLERVEPGDRVTLVLLDLVDERVIELDVVRSELLGSLRSADGHLVTWETADGKSWMVLDVDRL